MITNITFDFMDEICFRLKKFVISCRNENGEYCLTQHAESTPFALCFAIFCLHLIGEIDESLYQDDKVVILLRTNLEAFKKQRERIEDLRFDKPFLQLLTFTLSCLSLLGKLNEEPLADIVVPCLSKNVASDIEFLGALEGKAQSGNKAMFMAILLIHARDYLGVNTNNLIDEWVDLHVSSMNEYGFWGNSPGMTHLQFQNGYHQYEIFEYLNVNNPKIEAAAKAVASLADISGHFAPYPGGGGCYDYDAVSILTTNERIFLRYSNILERTRNVILTEQNGDGGFAESHFVRPRSLQNIRSNVMHVLSATGTVRWERMRYCLNLMRPKHNRVHTHWSKYSREWGESNLWDSWFRLLAIVRILVALDPASSRNWGFINFPGIGFHPSLHD